MNSRVKLVDYLITGPGFASLTSGNLTLTLYIPASFKALTLALTLTLGQNETLLANVQVAQST